MEKPVNIIFLHHSTGKAIWLGNTSKYLYIFGFEGGVQKWFDNYNKGYGTNYLITERTFPGKEPYGWKNYPYDYYNIWVKNGKEEYYMNEPTLTILSTYFNVIVWKHCFPVSAIADDSIANINSEIRSIQNYKLQYNALKKKMHEFSGTKFIVVTGAALVKNKTNLEQAEKARDFFNWVKNEWDEKDDNIFIWDLYELETDGGIYLKDRYAENDSNSHPNKKFSSAVSPLLCQRIVNVIEGRGDRSSLTGK